MSFIWDLGEPDREHLRSLAYARGVPVRTVVLEAIRAHLMAERAAHEVAVRGLPLTVRDHAAYARRRGVGHEFYVSAWHEVSLEAGAGFELSWMDRHGLYQCRSWVYLVNAEFGVSTPAFEFVIAE